MTCRRGSETEVASVPSSSYPPSRVRFFTFPSLPLPPPPPPPPSSVMLPFGRSSAKPIMTERCGSKLGPARGALRQSWADFCLMSTSLAAIATAVGMAGSQQAGWRGTGPS
ncbi:hypothetical protein JDV02_002315 [Purpureocillium takamizusanense]|uniref:Uncharacterized protein n=1 Tax=Purpureocillium takamizusanense TaxID=2060973 RepID=A0A9Q8Q926_9HYPO|nr:uncharacterized protein JDV02_002315 [Purpureocillium takamizusanense]UNI15818.1 hypothetical protein JDV02_002315 [Purpureocillium takamizusanense]